MRLVDDSLDDILDMVFLELFDLIEGRLGVASALDELDVLQVVNLGDDNVLLEMGRPALRFPSY